MSTINLYHCGIHQGNLKGEVSLYHWPPVWLVLNQLYDNWNFCFYLQNRLIKTSPTGGQWYSDTSPLSIPWIHLRRYFLCACWPNPNSISDFRSEATDEIVATEGSDAILATEGTDAVLATEGADVSSPGTNDIKLFTDVIYVFS